MTDRRIEDAEAIARGEAELPIGKLLDQHHRETLKMWWTNDGRIMHPSEMETDHVINALAFVRRTEPPNEEHRDYREHWIARFESELAWRRDGYGTDLRALLDEVVEELNTPVALLDKAPEDVAREQADRLRPHVEAGAHVGQPEADHTDSQRVAHLAGQLLQIVDAQAWHAMNGWLNVTRARLRVMETGR